MTGLTNNILGPSQAPSSRRSTRRLSVPPPRSSSPKKSGITGTARKSNGVDIFTRKSLQPQSEDLEDRENTPVVTPTRVAQPSRFSPSPDKSPLRDITANLAYMHAKTRLSLHEIEQPPSEIAASVEDDGSDEYQEPTKEGGVALVLDDDFAPVADDDDNNDALDAYDESEAEVEESGRPQSEEFGTPIQHPGQESDNIERPSEPEQSLPPHQNQANSRKKRKSDVLDQDVEARASSTPVKVRKTSQKGAQIPKPNEKTTPTKKPTTSKAKGKQPLKEKDTNTKMSARQEKELDDIIEKVRARPGPQRSLYILRRETPADDSVTHTRSGRISVKPLAYWRHERCVFGGSPGGASIQDGARFPLNSIKEIVRTEDVSEQVTKQRSKSRKKTNPSNVKPRKPPVEDSETSESEFDDSPKEDPEAEPWETDSGTLRGTVSIWDPFQQVPTDQEEEIEIAHAPGAIIAREVKGSALHEGPTFRYAKLLSTKFFGTGIVELPPGGIKRPKNSRKMHMGFFVVKGRVTVQVGPPDSDEDRSENRFSIGKGGFWQVPRGEIFPFCQGRLY
jgi:centromere protein C